MCVSIDKRQGSELFNAKSTKLADFYFEFWTH